MVEGAQDIRVKKTQMALCHTMMELLETKSFQKITVNDICQNAMVSRSTFYLHFEDKYQLLRYCMQVEREKLNEQRERSVDPRIALQRMLERVREQHRVYRNLFLNDVNLELVRMFQNVFHRFFSELLADFEEQGAELPGPVELVAVYCGNGLSGMMMWWIENDFPVSVEEMALCQYNLLSDIFSD